MIATICSELKEILASNLNWLDVSHGQVFANKIDVPNAGKIIVPYQWGTEVCKNDNFVTPNAAKRSVSWFESDGITLKTKTEGPALMSSQLTFCNWINCKLIDKDDAFVHDRVMMLAESEIERLKGVNTGSAKIVRVEVVKINMGADKILGKYGFTDKAQYSIHPYFGYSIVFNIQFSASMCTPITLNPC